MVSHLAAGTRRSNTAPLGRAASGFADAHQSPARAAAPEWCRNVDADPRDHRHLSEEMESFQGLVYARDGAIQRSELAANGRHKVAIDERSWHVLALDSGDRICACLRYLDESRATAFDQLWVRHAALARVPSAANRFRGAVEAGMQSARRLGMGFGEVGGWAVAESHRHSVEFLRIILAT
jgi:hypothetical protein